MFTLYKMIFYLKFLSHTVKFGQNRNKVDNVKIIIPQRKNRKFREEWRTQGTASKRAKCYLYKSPDYITLNFSVIQSSSGKTETRLTI